MRRAILLLLLSASSASLIAQTVRQAVGVNGGPSVSFPATVAGNLNVVVAAPGRLTTLSKMHVIDSMGQTYTQDGPCATPDGNGYVCVWYVCSGVGGVTSATVSGTDGIASVEFLEGTGIVSSSCAGASTVAAGTTAPSQISLTPDQPNELAVVAFACNGSPQTVNGNVSFAKHLNYGDDPLAVALTTSTTTLTAETDSGSSVCTGTGTKAGWDAVFAAFRTQPINSCPASAAVPSIAGCDYSSNLGSEPLGSVSSAQAVNLDVAAGTTVGSIAVLTEGVVNGDFSNSQGSTCTAATYSTNTACIVNLTFSPQAPGLRSGAIVFFSGPGDSGAILASIPIFGIGRAPQIAYGPGGTQSTVGSGLTSPVSIAVDGAGNVLIADSAANSIDKVTPAGASSAIGAGFVKPVGVAIDGAGNEYVADAGAPGVYVIPISGTQTKVGSGYTTPSGVAVDGSGNLYVSDSGAKTVFKITPSGIQSRIGSAWNQPAGLTVDADGNVYVADTGLAAVYKITPSGAQTTVGSGFSRPEAVTVDAAGNVYVIDGGTGFLYGVSPAGTVSPVAEGFESPSGVATDDLGNLYIADTGHAQVVKMDRSDLPSLGFATTSVGATSSDSPQTVGVEDIGNQSLTISALSYPLDFPEASGDFNACSGTMTLTPAEECDLPIDFTPQSATSFSESVTLTDNALNVSGAIQSISVSGTGTPGLTTQTISFTPIPTPVTFGVSPITLSATGGGSGNPVVFSVLSGPGSISVNTLTVTGAGTIVVAANQAGNSTYAAAAQVTQTVVVSQASQAIRFTAIPTPVTYGVSPISLSATGGGSGNSVLFSVVSGPASVSGSTLTVTGAGTIVVAANQAGNTNYAAAPQITQSVVVNPAPQTIDFTPLTSPVTYGSTSQSPLVFTLVQKCHPTSNTSNTCTFAKNVTAGDLVIGGAVIDNTIQSTGVHDGAGHAFTLSPNSPCSGGSVTTHAWVFYLLSSPGGTNTNTVVFTDNDGTNPGDYVDELWGYEFSVSGGTAAFDTDTNGCGSSGSSVNPVATLQLAGSNELAYFLGYLVGGKSAGVGSPWTLGTKGTAGGLDGYDTNASTSITTAVTPANDGWGIVMSMAIKGIPIGSIPLSATGGSSGNPVVFSIVSGPGSITNNQLYVAGAGTIVIAANQAGNANYAAAPQVTQSVVVNQATQTITFTPLASPITYPASPVTLTATGGASGNPVVFSVVSGPGTVSGSTLTVTGTGTIVVAANQAGNANFLAAPQVTQSIVVNQSSLLSQTITFTAIPSPVTFGVSPISLSATGGGSGNPVVFSVLSGPGTVSGNTLTITGAGTVVVAANQAGNATYSAAAQVTQSVVVSQAAQSITFTPPASPVTYPASPIALTATGGASGNPVVFSVVSGPGTVSGSTLTITGTGTIVVAANQAGNANYLAATQVTQSVVVNSGSLISQTITFTAISSPVTYGVSPIALSATGGASGNPVVFSVVSGPGSVSGNMLTITGAGTVVVAANQAGNATYASAPQVTQSVVVNKAAQTITFTPPTSPVTYPANPITLSATGGASGNAIVFSVVSGPGTVSGTTLTITGTGTIVVAANQAGNANYLAATQVTQSVVVNLASGGPGFTLVQKCHAASNTSNVCTFANPVAAGDLVIGGAVIDNTVAATGVKDGAGHVFTLSPNSPCTGGSVTSHAWVFYLLSSPGGSNTVVFSDSPNDNVDEIWAYEFSVSGGTAAFDTDTNGCAFTSSSTNPKSTLTLSGSNELAYFDSYVAGQATGVGSPWTVGTATSLGNVDGYDPSASSSITTSITPSGQGWGIVMAMALKIVPP
ncbi:MAG TPA: hypothetical protein VME68_13185 [Acidobacteriaceae bacterium]|nr:hypothetical protein [Acidobacteriaceae bacterium]